MPATSVPTLGPAGYLAVALKIMKMTDTSIFTCWSAKMQVEQLDFLLAGFGCPVFGEKRR
jgi:hypothetical protein